MGYVSKGIGYGGFCQDEGWGVEKNYSRYILLLLGCTALVGGIPGVFFSLFFTFFVQLRSKCILIW